MWKEYNDIRKKAIGKTSGVRGGDWCEIEFSDKSKQTWTIYPVDIPKNERICVTYKTGTKIVYFITKKELTTDSFFIYKYDTSNNVATKLGKGNNPIVLEEKYIEKISKN